MATFSRAANRRISRHSRAKSSVNWNPVRAPKLQAHRRAEGRPRVFTIGHSNREFDELLAALRAFEIALVVDVRHYPGSRKYPQFNRESLARELPRAGVAYRHLVALGGRRPTAKDSLNEGWEEAAFRGYADYARTPAFSRALDELIDWASKQATAIMCAEAVWWRCHRRIIADYLILRGVEVFHILGKGRADLAEMTPFARPSEDGTIVYPPMRGDEARP